MFVEVECDKAVGPVCGGSFADIYQGTLNGQKVALKLLRIYQITDAAGRAKLKRVRASLHSFNLCIRLCLCFNGTSAARHYFGRIRIYSLMSCHS